ncbi:MAG: hypothetical protein GX597_17400 [Anaerolineaceae bacterium]|nr:hypothetical protein [Anaerolineaceae bacterium]
MASEASGTDILALLNEAMARELQVSIQYMLQHAIGAGHTSAAGRKMPIAAPDRFVASHRMYCRRARP